MKMTPIDFSLTFTIIGNTIVPSWQLTKKNYTYVKLLLSILFSIPGIVLFVTAINYSVSNLLIYTLMIAVPCVLIFLFSMEDPLIEIEGVSGTVTVYKNNSKKKIRKIFHQEEYDIVIRKIGIGAQTMVWSLVIVTKEQIISSKNYKLIMFPYGWNDENATEFGDKMIHAISCFINGLPFDKQLIVDHEN